MYDDDLKKKLRYEQLITLCFWLSVDQGRLTIANMILEQDKLIQMLVANVFGNKNSTRRSKSFRSEVDNRMTKQIKTNSPPKHNNEEFSNTNYPNTRNSKKQLSMHHAPTKKISYQPDTSKDDESKEIGLEGGEDKNENSKSDSDSFESQENSDSLSNSKPSSISEMDDYNEGIKNSGMPEHDYDKYNKFDTINDLLELKLLMMDGNQKFMSNILKTAMKLEEEKLACYLIAHYDTEIYEEIIVNAIEKDYYMILHYIWAFGKNKHELKNNLGEFILYNELFQSIQIVKEGAKLPDEVKKESIDQFVRNVVNWLVITDDNILIALLEHEYDDLALD